MYTDRVIELSKESTERLLRNLLTNKESVARGEAFIADIKDRVTHMEDGSVVIDIKDIDIQEAD